MIDFRTKQHTCHYFAVAVKDRKPLKRSNKMRNVKPFKFGELTIMACIILVLLDNRKTHVNGCQVLFLKNLIQFKHFNNHLQLPLAYNVQIRTPPFNLYNLIKQSL